MEATVAERGQITLPKAVRDALGLVKGTTLAVELDGGRIILRKDVKDALSRVRGRFKLPDGVTTDDVMRELRVAHPAIRSTFEARTNRNPRLIAIDSSVLIDLLGGDARADSAETCLRLALHAGPVVVSDVVVSEVTAGLGHGSEMPDALEEMGIRFLPLELRSAIRAGEMQGKYKERLKRLGKAPATRRTVADFLVGAHAMLQCHGLITRDAGFFRDYFKGLKVIVPKAQ